MQFSFCRSPEAGEPPFHHFGVLPTPERPPYTILAFSRARRAYPLSFWQSPDAGETPFHHFIVLPLPERTTYTILAFSRARRAYLLSFWQSSDVGERANRLQKPTGYLPGSACTASLPKQRRAGQLFKRSVFLSCPCMGCVVFYLTRPPRKDQKTKRPPNDGQPPVYIDTNAYFFISSL